MRLLLLIAGALLAPATTAAANPWSLTTAPHAGEAGVPPAVALAGRGRVAVAHHARGGGLAVAAGTRRSLKTLGGRPGRVGAFDVAVGADGGVIAVWAEHGSVRYAVGRVGGRLGPARTIEHGPGRSSAQPAVVLRPSGTAVVVYDTGPPRGHIRLVTVSPSGGLARIRRDLGRGGFPRPEPFVAANARGALAFAWSAPDGTGRDRTAATVFTAAGRLLVPHTLPAQTGSTAARQSVAIDESGRAAVAWEEDTGPGSQLVAMRIGADGTLGERLVGPTQAPGHRAFGPAVDLGAGGDLRLAWLEPRPGPHATRAPVRLAVAPAAAGAFGAPTILDGDPSAELVFARLGAGRSLLTWVDENLAARAALVRADGRAARIAAPPGRMGNGAAVAAAGDRVALAWTQSHRVRVALRTLPR